MAEIKEWFMNIPVVTRAWFGLSVALPILGRFGLLNPYHMMLTSDFINRLQIWRPFTATFYYPITSGTGFHYLINLFFLYNYSKNLETGEFSGKPADYLFLLIFNWAALVLMGVFTNLFLLMDPLILSVLYIWCQLNKETIVSFWFGTKFQAKYLPWVLLGFNLLLGGGGFSELMGIIVGHLYYYIKYKYPEDHNGIQLVDTPSILYRYLPSYSPFRTTHFNAFPTASGIRERRTPTSPTGSSTTDTSSSSGRSWGRGQLLGNRS